ncbi:MAG: MBOAT family protein [Defluviitaleaceae bacterium]|nr:MBOAT family protein [Defluviitaleaceae bacterium]
MIFSSITFLYFFLPIAILLYFVTPMPSGSAKYRNMVLLALSLFFYAWGEPVFIIILILQCVTSWALALLIDKYRGKPASKVVLIISMTIDLGVLALFKYADFIFTNINSWFNAEIGLLGLILPIGISFYTFQILSYTIDLYRGKIKVNKSLLDFATYVTIFPPLLAGPIVRYADIEDSLAKRKHSLEDIAIGARRFVIGLGKKVLIADQLGVLISHYQASSENTVLFTWLYLVAFVLKLYFDFSGYSDMAIGLGRIFGFRFMENFNYPHISKSMAEFWTRWHISLVTWFRDYVYFPLGGNRVKIPRFVFNLVLLWFLIGFWHGASWNFVAWGMYYAAILLFERFVLSKYLDKLPNFIRHFYVIMVLLTTGVFFDAASLAAVGETFSVMFGFGADSFSGVESLYYLRSYLVIIGIAIIGSTPMPKNIANRILEKKQFRFLEPVVLALLLLVVTGFIVDGSFNPFVYFRF